MTRIELDEWIRRARFLHNEMEEQLELLQLDLEDYEDAEVAERRLFELEDLHTKMGHLLETMEQVSLEMVQHELAEKA